MTCDKWGEVNLLSKLQVPSFKGLGFMMFLRLGGKGSLNELINDKGVFRIALATPGLLKSIHIHA